MNAEKVCQANSVRDAKFYLQRGYRWMDEDEVEAACQLVRMTWAEGTIELRFIKRIKRLLDLEPPVITDRLAGGIWLLQYRNRPVIASRWKQPKKWWPMVQLRMNPNWRKSSTRRKQ
jgi:hypothetical protein